MAPRPYDKHPEWETLTAHSAAVRHCCIGSRESGHPLIATASDDSSVQLWDTRNMPSPKVVKLPVSKVNTDSVRSVRFETAISQPRSSSFNLKTVHM